LHSFEFNLYRYIPGNIHEDRWQARGAWGDGGRADERSSDVARGAAYNFPEEVIHAGRVVTPGRCQIVYMHYSSCHQIEPCFDCKIT
jgi:hypothetical protein